MQSVSGRRLVVLADGHLDHHFGKTAIGIIRYRPGDVVAVIESGLAGKTTQEAIGLGGAIPIVGSLRDALEHQPDTLLIGVATRGGLIPDEWRGVLKEAITHGLDIISGLHHFVSDDPEFRSTAATSGVNLVDVRRPPEDLSVAEAKPHRLESTVITLVGSDCAVGKMSVALDMQGEAQNRGVQAAFVATGQTGMMIDGAGIPLDRIIGDFMSGAVEKEVLAAAQRNDIVLVEGQGSLLHPAYSGVTLALLHGSQADGLILTVMPGREEIEDYDIKIPPVLELIEIYEAAAAWVKPAPVIGIAVNSLGLSEIESDRFIESTHVETGLPVTDTFRRGAGALVDAVVRFHKARTEILPKGGDDRE